MKNLGGDILDCVLLLEYRLVSATGKARKEFALPSTMHLLD